MIRDSIKSYDELKAIDNFEDRLRYLMLFGDVAVDTFGYQRYLNQILYKCYEWRNLRPYIITRDNGCDLACDGYDIYGNVLIHHINPITAEDVLQRRPIVFDPNNLVTTTLNTHNIIHYGSESDIDLLFYKERSANDTAPWKRRT